MYFRLMHRRLLEQIRKRVRSGEVTERGLARTTGLSQSHLHNALKGVKLLSAETADALMLGLRLGVQDLLREEELGLPVRRAYAEVPLAEGRLGPGHAFPDLGRCRGQVPFLPVELTGLKQAVAVRAAADAVMRRLFQGEDVLLLDRLAAAPERIYGYYALDTGSGGLVRRVEGRPGELLIGGENGAAMHSISLAGRNILEVVKARVVWIGHYLEAEPLAPGPTEEAGAEHRCPGRQGRSAAAAHGRDAGAAAEGGGAVAFGVCEPGAGAE